MADHGWGPTPAHADAGEGVAAPSADAFATAELQQALPVTGNGNVGNDPLMPETWNGTEQTGYDYEAFAGRDNHDWEGNAKVYEWDGQEGDIGPEFPELEVQLFGNPNNRARPGIDFSKLAAIELYQEGPTRVEPIAAFKDAGLHPAMLKNVELAGYELPTPIQRYCLPAIHLGHDVIGIAQTGSGKTAAFLIPILNKLMGKAKKLAADRPNPATFREGVDRCRAEPLVVIVCPTRELAVQIFNEARKFCYRTMLRPCVVYGGGSMRDQMAQLQKGCDVLVACPGRLIHMMDNPEVLTFRRVRYMVIDEADQMLQDDWAEELNKIMSGGEQEEGNINYLLFSATFPKGARDLAKAHLADTHVRFRVGRAGSSHENIKQSVIWVEPHLKKQALLDLLKSLPPTRTIIFVNSRRAVEEVDDFLFKDNMPCTSMHGERNQVEREASMRAFRSGKCPILIATGATARGIDVRNVMHVINYDLPSMEYGGIEEYTHRIGRTGRIGHRGLASSFYSERDEAIASVLTRTLMETNQEIPDFLQSYIPEGDAATNLKFEADSDFEEEGFGGGGDGDGYGWGAADDGADEAAADEPPIAADAWATNGDAAAAETGGGAGGWGAGDANTGNNAGGDGWGAGASQATTPGW